MRFLTGVTMMTPGFAQNMTSLREMYFPKNAVTNSGADATFLEYGSPNLVKIVMPNTYQRIKRYSFQNSNKATIIIGDPVHGSSILSINNWHALIAASKIVIYSQTPPYWSNNDSSFAKASPRGADSLPNNCKVYVPDSAVDTYKNSGADMWGNYASRIYPISEFEGEL